MDNADILAINKAIQQLAQEKQLTYIDLHRQLIDEQGRLKAALSSDGIHLNGEGYLIWKKEIEELIR